MPTVSRKIKHYAKVSLKFAENSLTQEMNSRTNFLSHLLGQIIIVLISLASLNILYQNITHIAGWSYYETLLLTGVANILFGIFFGPLVSNMAQVAKTVFDGSLDIVLSLPLSSQFVVSTRKTRLFSLGPLISGVAFSLTAINKLALQPTSGQIITAIGLSICGLIICYALWFISVTPAIWFSTIWDLHEIFINLYQITKRPPEIYQQGLRILLTAFVPLLVPVAFPTKALLNTITPAEIIWAPFIAAGLLYLSSYFWKFALKYYSSASS